MPVLVVGGIKGGSGKSTLALNLVVIRSRLGKRVLLVDSDEQRSVSDWAEHRESLNLNTTWTTINLIGSSVRSQLLKISDDYDDVIVDTGGRDTTSQRSALTVADLFLVPFQPRSLDVWTIGKVSGLLKEIKAVNPALRAYSVLNRADCQGSDNDGASDILKEFEDLKHLPNTIRQRKAFSNATAEGKGVVELKVKDKKASFEIEGLCFALFGK